MPNLQTSYNPVLAPALAGMIVDMRNRTVISRELQSPGLNFGAVVLRGTTDHTCSDITGTGSFLGISVLDPTVSPVNSNADAQGYTAAVLIKGAIWVTVGANVVPGQPAYYTPAGVITNVANGNTAIPGTFETTAAAGALAVLKLSA